MSGRSASMFLPSPELGACLYSATERDTRGRSLTDAERFNYFPTIPMVIVSWTFHGVLHLVEGGWAGAPPVLGPALPRLVLSGPQRRPTVSWSPGPVHVLSMAFYPEAASQLLGVAVETLVDRIQSLDAVAPRGLVDACDGVFSADDGRAPFQRVEDALRPLWRGPHRESTAPILGEWIRDVATRATRSRAGRGVRQVQRRVRSWTGRSLRELELFTRVEEALLQEGGRLRGGALELAELAAAAGYSDQSHLGREIRRVTGLSPARIRARIAEDEAFWFYRLVEELLEGKGASGARVNEAG